MAPARLFVARKAVWAELRTVIQVPPLVAVLELEELEPDVLVAATQTPGPVTVMPTATSSSAPPSLGVTAFTCSRPSMFMLTFRVWDWPRCTVTGSGGAH